MHTELFLSVPSALITNIFCLSIDHFESVVEKFSHHLLEDQYFTEAAYLLITLHDLCAVIGVVMGTKTTDGVLIIEGGNLSDWMHMVTLIKSYSLLIGMHTLHTEAARVEMEIIAILMGDRYAK